MRKGIHAVEKLGITFPKMVFLESPSEVASVGFSTIKSEAQPIHHERVEKDLKEARAALRLVAVEVQKPLIDDLRRKLEEIEKKYEKISTNEPLKVLEKEVYAQLQPVLLKAAQRELKNCKKILDPRFEKQGMSFTFENSKVQAVLNDHYDIESVRIDGVTVNFLEPVSFEKFEKNKGNLTQAVVLKIVERFGSRNLEVNEAHGRYEFSTEEAGRLRDFIATSEDILEIKEDVPPKKLAQYLLINKKYKSQKMVLGEMFSSTAVIFADKKEIAEHLRRVKKKLATDSYGIDELYTFEEIDRKNFSPAQKKAWEIFLSTIRSFREIKSQYAVLKKECANRKLEGRDALGKTFRVHEHADPSMSGDFSWNYFDENGKEFKEIVFFEGRCSNRKKIEKGAVTDVFFVREDGSISNHWKPEAQVWYSRQGKKEYHSLIDSKNPENLETVWFYDAEENLLDAKVLEQMRPAKLERLLLEKLGKCVLSEEDYTLFAKACFSSAEYIKYCPRGKEILMKAARLAPYFAFMFFEKYVGNLYAIDILEEAALHLKPETVLKFFAREPFLSSLSENQKEYLLNSKIRRNPNFSTAKNFLKEESARPAFRWP